MVSLAQCTLATVLLVATGCRQVSSPPSGQGSFDFVVPEEAPSSERKAPALALGDAVMAAEPILPLAVPVYPREALRMKPGAVVVGVRITVDPSGAVSSVASSPVVFSSPNSYRAGFRESVDAAVAQWRFTPAVIQRMESGTGVDGEPVVMIKGTEKTTWTFDVAFRFTASGDVLGSVPGLKESGGAGRGGLREFFVRLIRGRVLESAAP